MYNDAVAYFQASDALLYLSAPVLIVGGLNWLATGIQNIRKGEAATKSDDLLNAVGLPTLVVNIIYILVGIAALGLLAYVVMKLSKRSDAAAVAVPAVSVVPSAVKAAEQPAANASPKNPAPADSAKQPAK